MIKIVTDTNVLVSAVISDGFEYEVLKLAKLEKVKLILSPQILGEFVNVIKRPKIGFSEKQIRQAIDQIKSISHFVHPEIKLAVVKEDPDDNKILEAGVTGEVDYIVSGDKHLLRLGEIRKIKIVNARDFLSIKTS